MTAQEERYQELTKEAKELMKQIQKSMKTHVVKSVSWGHCGDMGYVVGKLHEIAGFMGVPVEKK